VIERTFDLVFVRYQDHVMFNRCSPLLLKPQIRQAVGWLNYQCDDFIILSWDKDAEPPTLKGGDPKASGLVLLKTAILELKNLQAYPAPLQKSSRCHLNSTHPKDRDEYALRPTERKTQEKEE